MARYDRDTTRERHEEQPALPFPERTEYQFLQERDQVGSAGKEEILTSHNRDQLRAAVQERGIDLRESEVATLTDIGTFRALAVEDLTRYRYAGDPDLVRRDLQSLADRGLIQSRTLYPERAVYVTLTRAGHRAIASRQREERPHQRLYHGFVKPRETQHDATLYRLYQQELERIQKIGGRVDRVVLDFELKQSINRRLAVLSSLPKAKQEQEKQAIAEAHSLKVVNGKIPLPDLRLEYEDRDHEMNKVDLELVTQHYHRENLAAKAKAGFAMYASTQDAVRLRPAMQDPEIMQDILSL